MMDPAYFVGRSEILAWINSSLHLNLSKVEEVCSSSRSESPNHHEIQILRSIMRSYWTIFFLGSLIAGVFRCGSLPTDGRGSHRNGADAQGELRRQERVRDDTELQGSSRCL